MRDSCIGDGVFSVKIGDIKSRKVYKLLEED